MKPFCARPLTPAAALLAALLAPGLAQADFTNGDFTGWSTDTDGLGTPTPLSPDFQVVGSPGSCQGRLEAD